MKIGIDGIAFDVPQNFLDMTLLAKARGVEPSKYTVGLGQTEMATSTPCEDTVALAAGAGQRLMKNFKVDPASIALLIIGTETGVDHSKAASTFVHQILGLSQECRVFEVKHACYGGMAGITVALNYIQSGRAKGRKALIIASDIARYGKGTAGEPTQGAGAVAMLVSENPRLLELDCQNEGFYSKNVMDFWRPNYSKEAFADGHYSIKCYLDALEGAYGMYKKSVLQSDSDQSTRAFAERYQACLYHVPFVKMAQKAHQKLLEIEAGVPFEKGSPQQKEALDDYEKRVLTSLELNARVGNVYTGSLFFSLINLLEDSGARLAGQAISLFSYGSGCAAEFMSGTVVPGAEQWMSLDPFRDILQRRTSVSIEQYEEILDGCAHMDKNGEFGDSAVRWKLSRSVLYLGTKEHKRVYSVNGEMLT